MIDEILEIAGAVQAQRNRIDSAANDIAVTLPKFRRFEQAVENLDEAIASLKRAATLIQNSQVAKIIWALDTDDD